MIIDGSFPRQFKSYVDHVQGIQVPEMEIFGSLIRLVRKIAPSTRMVPGVACGPRFFRGQRSFALS